MNNKIILMLMFNEIKAKYLSGKYKVIKIGAVIVSLTAILGGVSYGIYRFFARK